MNHKLQNQDPNPSDRHSQNVAIQHPEILNARSFIEDDFIIVSARSLLFAEMFLRG